MSHTIPKICAALRSIQQMCDDSRYSMECRGISLTGSGVDLAAVANVLEAATK